MATETKNIGEGTLCSWCYPAENKGNLDGRKVEVSNQPIFIALIVLGLIWGVVAATGFTAFGSGISTLGQIDAIIMGAVGSVICAVLVISGIVGLVREVKEESNERQNYFEPELLKDKTDLAKIGELLTDRSWTFVLQEDGNYTVVMKHAPEKWEKSGRIEELYNDIPFNKLEETTKSISRAQNSSAHLTSSQTAHELTGSGVWDTLYTYVKTSPDQPTDRLVDDQVLSNTLQPKTFTFVLQVNGKYSLVHRLEKPTDMYVSKITSDIEPDQLAVAGTQMKNQDVEFIKTSKLPTDLLIDNESLAKLLQPKTFTFVLQVNGKYSRVYRLETVSFDSVIKRDIGTDQLAAEREKLEKVNVQFVKTSQLPTDLLLTHETLEKLLQPKTFTFVRQVNGKYSLVNRLETADNAFNPQITPDIEAGQLTAEREKLEKVNVQFVKTWELPK